MPYSLTVPQGNLERHELQGSGEAVRGRYQGRGAIK